MKKVLIFILLISLISACTASNAVSNKDGSVYYEIYVGSFNDSNNDKMGDLNGITDKLDYLQDLGVSGLWLMPISESNSYHKYDVIDYMSVDEDYGTISDFENLVVKAKEHNIDIILDLVLNHTSSENPWFIEAKKNELNNTCDVENSKCEYYNFATTAKSGYTKINDNLYYESLFWSEMPDLNLDNLEVRNEITKIVDFWMDKGVKGFRLDAVLYYYAGNITKNNEFEQWLENYVKSKNQDAFLVGEVWSDNASTLSSYAGGIDSLFDFSLSDSDGKINKAIINQNGSDLADYFVEYNKQIKDINPQAYDSPFLSNHDQARSGGYLLDDNKKKLAASIYLLAPGMPFIYYGEEIGMKGSGIDENKRLAMLWGEDNDCNNPENANYTHQITTDVTQELADSDSLLNYYKKIIAIRNKYQLFKNGNISKFMVTNKEIMGLTFSDDQDSISVLHNLSDQMITEDLDANYEILDQVNIADKASINSNNQLIIYPYSSAIIKVK